MNRVRVITFDMGGTLLHPDPSVGTIYARVMAEHGLHYSAAELDDAFGRAWTAATHQPTGRVDADMEKEWWRALVGQVLADRGYHGDYTALFEALWEIFAQPSSWRLTEHAVVTLETLRRRGYRLGVLSNWDLRLRPLLMRLELDRHFDHLVISAEVGVEKPDTRIFRHTEALFAEPPERFLHIGDSDHHDAGGAAAAGWQCLLLDHGAETTGRRIGSLDDLLSRLPTIT